MIDKIDFSKSDGLVPAIIQDAESEKVLMLGYMNREAFEQTEKVGRVCFYSRSRKKLWIKGEESGNFLNVKSIKLDCDQDALLIKVDPEGPTCHTGSDTCWNEVNRGSHFLFELEKIIETRKNDNPKNSYTASLFEKGVNKIAQKVGEEAVELVIESKDNDENLFLNEAADLMYHLLVLLCYKGLKLKNVETILSNRHK